MGRIGGGELLIVFLIIFLWAVPAAIIAKKAGFSPLWGLAAMVPGLNFAMVWVFALVTWPAARGGAPDA
jgi:hypothetical protein